MMAERKGERRRFDVSYEGDDRRVNGERRQVERQSRLEANANSPGLRLTSQVFVILAGIIGAPAIATIGWLAVEIWDSNKEKVELVTSALVQNQEAFLEMAIVLTKLDGRLESNTRSLIRVNEDQSKAWTQYVKIQRRLTAIEVRQSIADGINNP